MEENEPAKSKKNSPPLGSEPQAKKISKKISPPPGFEPRAKKITKTNSPPPGFKPQAKKIAPTKPPPTTAPTSPPPPKPEQKEKRVNKIFVPREDGGPVTRSKNKSSWADVAK